jgi:hypothetical protein
MASEKRPKDAVSGIAFPSLASTGFIVVLPAVAADLDFPSVVVPALPSGFQIWRADYAMVVGSLFDTSGAENQVNQASKTIRVMKQGGSWGTDDMVAMTFGNNSLQCPADLYRGGAALFGATDIKSVVDGAGTYLFRSEQTNRGQGVTVTGASLELLDVVSIIRMWLR